MDASTRHEGDASSTLHEAAAEAAAAEAADAAQASAGVSATRHMPLTQPQGTLHPGQAAADTPACSGADAGPECNGMQAQEAETAGAMTGAAADIPRHSNL